MLGMMPLIFTAWRRPSSANSRAPATQPVFIRCDQNVSFGAFARVVDALEASELTNLNIVTEPLETKPGS